MPYEAIPLELEQHILSYLKDDIPSLRACALTCHRWVYSTQRYLFARVLLDFRHVPFPSQAHPPDRFCQLLLSSPRISACVRELSIVISHGMEDQDVHRLTDVLQLCLPLLGHLRGISLGRASAPGVRRSGYIWPVSWHFIPSVVRNELSTTFRSHSLANIRLSHMRGIPLSVLALAGCPRLEGLFLEDVTFGGGVEGHGNQGPSEWVARPPRDLVLQSPRRSLKALRLALSEQSLQTFAQWATTPECPLDISSLEHLSVTMVKQYTDHSWINALLDECAGSLLTFCCRMEIQGTYDTHIPSGTPCTIGVALSAVSYPLDIRRLHRLRTLRLAVARPKKTIPQDYRAYIPNILAQLDAAAHPALEEIYVALDASEWGATPAAVRAVAARVRAHVILGEGKGSDRALGRCGFPALRKMVWMVSGNACLSAALADDLTGAGWGPEEEEETTGDLKARGPRVQVEVTTCDGDSAGYLAEGDEDIFEII